MNENLQRQTFKSLVKKIRGHRITDLLWNFWLLYVFCETAFSFLAGKMARLETTGLTFFFFFF